MSMYRANGSLFDGESTETRPFKYRHELKYVINRGDYMGLRANLSAFAKKDRNCGEDGNYNVRSLYFDNYNDTALREKLLGIADREKFRIRIYNGDSGFIRLEKKIKRNGLTAKVSAVIDREECLKMAEGDFDGIDMSKRPLIAEFAAKSREKLLREKTIVDYEREAYVFAAGNVRITFDKKISSGMFSRDLFVKDLPLVSVMPPEMMILEVKYDNFLPDIIKNIISVADCGRVSASKYTLCRFYS